MKLFRLFNLYFIDFQKKEEVVDLMTAENSDIIHLITPNVQIIDLLHQNPELILYYSKHAVAIPDGFPIVFCIRNFLKKPVIRYTGADLLQDLLPKINHLNKLVICSNLEVATRIHLQNSTVFVAPEKSAFNHQIIDFQNKIIQEIINNQVKFIFIGIGNPNQMILGKLLDEKIRINKLSCRLFQLGNSFEFLTGIDKRAPKWMQNANLEWLHRFLLHPKKMFKRYFIDSYRFIFYAIEAYKKSR